MALRPPRFARLGTFFLPRNWVCGRPARHPGGEGWVAGNLASLRARRLEATSIAWIYDGRQKSRGRPSPGTPLSGKISELRLDSGILGIHGPVFCAPFVVNPSMAVSRIYWPRPWCWLLMATSRGTAPGNPRGSAERFGAVK